MNTGETKDDVFTRSARHAQRIENENKFSQFGNTKNTQNTKLMRRLKTLKQEQDQKQKAMMALEKSNMANIDDEEDKEGSYWIVDRSTCETTEQQCVLWHFIRCCLGVGMVWGAVELSLNGLPSARNGGEIIPILLGVIGGMLMIHSFKTLWKDYTKGLCPCQEVLNKQEMYDGQHNQGNDLEASISLAHARANQLNRAAMELPTVKDIEKRSHNNNNNNNKKSIKNQTDVGVVKDVDGFEGNAGIVNDDPSYSNSSGSYYSSEDDEDENSSSDDDVMERSQPYTDRKHNITKTSDKDNDNENENDNNGQGETKIEKQSPTERTNNNGWTNEVVTEATTEVTATWEDTSDEEDISTSFDQLEQRLASKSKKSETRKKKKKKKKKMKKKQKNKLSVKSDTRTNIQRRPGSGIGMIPRVQGKIPRPPKQ